MRKLSDLSPAELFSLALTNKRVTNSKYDLQILDINPWKNQRKRCIKILSK